MKKLLFIVGLFLSLNFAFSQSVKTNIENDFVIYSKLISENKIDDAMEYINPKLFEIIPRESMKSLFEAVFKIPNIDYKISHPIISEISDIKRIDNVDYAKIKYISPIEMKIKNIDLSDENKLQTLLNSFESKFGKGNVKYDKVSGFFKINAHKEVIANSDNNQTNWKFVTIDSPKMNSLLEKIIPSELLK